MSKNYKFREIKKSEITEKFRKSLIRKIILFVFAVSSIVALVVMAPLYSSLNLVESQKLDFLLENYSTLVKEHSSRIKDTSDQIASRTRARQLYEQFLEGRLTELQFRKKISPILEDALNRTENLKGIKRLDTSFKVKISIGEDIPREEWPEFRNSETVLSGPYETEDNIKKLVVASPIKNKENRTIGYDLTSFSIPIDQLFSNLDSSLGFSIFGKAQGDLRLSVNENLKNLESLKLNRFNDFKQETVSGSVYACNNINGTPWIGCLSKSKSSYLSPVITSLSLLFVVVLLILISLSFLLKNSLLSLTKKMIHQDEVVEVKHKLDHSSRLASVGSLAAGLAHEINNPLTAIRLLSDKLYSIAQVSSGKNLSKDMKNIESSIARIEDVVDCLSEFAGGMNLHNFKSLKIQTLIDSLSSNIQFKLLNQKIDLNIDTEQDLEIYGDVLALRLVLEGVIENAIYALQKTQNKKIKIITKSRKEDQFIQISILNNGEKIPLFKDDVIFEPFYSEKPVGQGSGLGLSTIHGIVESHRGKIFVDRSYTETCFTILIPNARSGKQSSLEDISPQKEMV